MHAARGTNHTYEKKTNLAWYRRYREAFSRLDHETGLPVQPSGFESPIQRHNDHCSPRYKGRFIVHSKSSTWVENTSLKTSPK
ncbi:hypothetical protein HO173_012321 [Letharia columbiana]|uniref:Uncharacterized protein n=1 Tax=Letharia columbiana TaxID=112416 RepID=A0A8H6CNK9_9LECA|nr:uncharacterized protein HO173_012321 [Letharia columbiana]KAF6226817.1 hypothetical protein HO173_012321 [Letharia columbiana]